MLLTKYLSLFANKNTTILNQFQNSRNLAHIHRCKKYVSQGIGYSVYKMKIKSLRNTKNIDTKTPKKESSDWVV